MRTLLLFSLIVVAMADLPDSASAAPTVAPLPAATTASRAAPRAAQAATRPRAAAGRSGMAITVTNPMGATLPGVHVELTGPTDRSGDTGASGQINFARVLAGTYRLRFSGDEVTTFEREVILRTGQVQTLDITLTPAPDPEPATAAVPAPAAAGPRGQPDVLSIPERLEQEFVGTEPRRESLLSCSGAVRSTMIQINDVQPARLYAHADAMYYVLGGEGTVSLNGSAMPIVTNTFVSVPRGTPHSFTKRGSRPLVLLSVLGGEPCEQAQ